VESSSSWREDWECLVNAFVRVKLGSWTVRSVRVLWPIKWVCDLCNRRVVACLCKFSQDTCQGGRGIQPNTLCPHCSSSSSRHSPLIRELGVARLQHHHCATS
jgi:hypothetical protein